MEDKEKLIDNVIVLANVIEVVTSALVKLQSEEELLQTEGESIDELVNKTLIHYLTKGGAL